MSDRAFQDAGDSAGISIDTGHQKIFTGKDALHMENMIRHHNISQNDLDKICCSNETNTDKP